MEQFVKYTPQHISSHVPGGHFECPFSEKCSRWIVCPPTDLDSASKNHWNQWRGKKNLLLFKNTQTKKNKVGLSFPDNLEKRSQEKDIC